MAKHPRNTLAESILKTADIRVADCAQCGKCTAGCPMASYMDLSPNQVMRLAQTPDPEDRKRVLSCSAIWYCAGCLTCTQRCPRKNDPAAVMDVLREEAVREGLASPETRKILAFHRIFLKIIEYAGRLSEVPLVSLYKLASGDLLQDVVVAPVMLAKGKLPLVPHRIRDRAAVRRIFRKCRGGKR